VEPALRLIEGAKYPLERMHTHTFALEDADSRLRTLDGRVQASPRRDDDRPEWVLTPQPSTAETDGVRFRTPPADQDHKRPYKRRGEVGEHERVTTRKPMVKCED